MLVTISGKHIEVTDAIRAHAEDKVSKLPRYYDRISHVEVILDSVEGGKMTVEIIAHVEHSKVFVGTETDEDLYRCIDMAVHKIEGQLRKAKGKERDDKFTGTTQSQ